MAKIFETAKILKSADGSAELTYYAEAGGYLNQLVLSKQGKKLSVLPVYETLEDTMNNPNYRCTVLFPFPNRLRDGKYSFEGKDYQFPINEKHNHNNLHGFLKEYTPEVEIKGADSNKPSIVSRYVYDGTRDYYPFPAEVIVEYAFTSSADLEVTFTVNNTGKTSMPVGTGWHPYFNLGEKVDDLFMQFPACNRVVVDDRLLPTGELPRDTRFDDLTLIKDTKLDHCFIPLKGGVEEVAVKLWSEKAGAGIEVWQDKNFGYIQVYTPPDRKTVAVEPMSCNINAFQSNDGLTVLAAGESFSGKFGVRMLTSK